MEMPGQPGLPFKKRKPGDDPGFFISLQKLRLTLLHRILKAMRTCWQVLLQGTIDGRRLVASVADGQKIAHMRAGGGRVLS